MHFGSVWSDFYVFLELDSMRVIAGIALQLGELELLDELELAYVRRRKLEPQGPNGESVLATYEECEPLRLFHGDQGLVISWVVREVEDCDACGGKGELTARGKNGRCYHVECPECDGLSQRHDSERFLATDIDGVVLEPLAA